MNKFDVGDSVRLIKIGGPKMLIGKISGHIEFIYQCCWFDKDHRLHTFDFAERMLEKAR